MRDIIREARKLKLPDTIIAEIEALYEEALGSLAESIKSEGELSWEYSYANAHALLAEGEDPENEISENPDILETGNLPLQKLPPEHFEDLVKRKGRDSIATALKNVALWNTDKNPELSNWAKKTRADILVDEPSGGGPGGMCVCPECGNTLAHEKGIPCNEKSCPNCDSLMMRQMED